jgi:translation initiation factor IF-2
LSKVKVFTLAKRFGYKSAEFVDILRNIGFPVSSYQASIEEWDVPVIEERLLKGGLLNPSEPVEKEQASDKRSADDGGKRLSFDDLAQMMSSTETPAEPASSVAEPVAEAPTEAETPVEDEVAAVEFAPAETGTVPAGAEVEAVAEIDENTAVPVAEPEVEVPLAEPTPEPETQESDTNEESEGAAPEADSGAEADIASSEADQGLAQTEQPPMPTPTPTAKAATETPAPAKPVGQGQSESGKATDRGKGRKSAKAKPAAQAPSPKPKRSARKVGKIDLAALGLIKSQHQEKRRTTTFSDIRDRVASTRREQRARQRDTLRARRQGKVGPKKVSTVARVKDVVLQSPVTVKNFSTATGVGINSIMRSLMKMGVMASINAAIESEAVELLAEELDLNIQYREESDIEAELMEEIMAARKAVDDSSLVHRDPVIAFLGHVDHGKTSLIDAIRTTRVAGKEAGGITQHIGAYRVELPTGKGVTILDTPGHAAFTAMRARGAQTTDLVVLVVAADDGVMPQTEEAINHAKAAGVPIVVAINKVDVKGANPEQVKSQLAGLGLQPEDWGGDVGMVEVSALRMAGIDDLLERVLLEAEVLDLKAHIRGDAMGTILEAKLEKGRGKVVTVLVQDGTIKSKDVVLAGYTFGKVRLIFDHNGKPLKSAGPGIPIEISGLEELPAVGEQFYVVKDAKVAKEVADKRQLHRTEIERASKSKVSLSNIFDRIDESNAQHIKFVVKADVQGTVEVLRNTLSEMSTSEVILDVVHSGVGGVSDNDVTLAHTAEGVVIAFNVAPDNKAKQTAEREGVEIRRYEVIYDVVDDIEKAIEGLLTPDTIEEICGHAVVLEVFRSSRWGTIAGCRIESGVARRSCRARLIRDGKPIFTGQLESLRRFKDDAREVTEGNECGLKIENYDDIKAGDEIELIDVIEKARTLEEVQATKAD